MPAWTGQSLFLVRQTLMRRLLAAGIDEAEIEATHMLNAVIAGGEKSIWLDPELCLDNAQAGQLEVMCLRRETREPLSHILGSWGFWSLDLNISQAVLTPRADTERLVEIALENLGTGSLSVLDLGTGSGAILLALLSEQPAAIGVGVDLSPSALKIASQNAKNSQLDQRITFVEGGWDVALDHAPFDLVVSNPPYIASEDIETLDPEVREFEPRLALDGGADGLDAYRNLLPLLEAYLKPGGHFSFEIGAGQGQSVMVLAQRQAHISNLSMDQDLGGRDRVLSGVRK